MIIALMMEAARTSETSVDNYFTRQYIPEDNPELQKLTTSFRKYRLQPQCTCSSLFNTSFFFFLSDLTITFLDAGCSISGRWAARAFRIRYMFIWAFLLTVTDTIASQSIDLSSWNTLSSVEWRDGKWMMNWKGSVKKRSWPNLRY
jgi:hypothetical protein